MPTSAVHHANHGSLGLGARDRVFTVVRKVGDLGILPVTTYFGNRRYPSRARPGNTAVCGDGRHSQTVLYWALGMSFRISVVRHEEM